MPNWSEPEIKSREKILIDPEELIKNAESAMERCDYRLAEIHFANAIKNARGTSKSSSINLCVKSGLCRLYSRWYEYCSNKKEFEAAESVLKKYIKITDDKRHINHLFATLYFDWGNSFDHKKHKSAALLLLIKSAKLYSKFDFFVERDNVKEIICSILYSTRKRADKTNADLLFLSKKNNRNRVLLFAIIYAIIATITAIYPPFYLLICLLSFAIYPNDKRAYDIDDARSNKILPIIISLYVIPIVALIIIGISGSVDVMKTAVRVGYVIGFGVSIIHTFLSINKFRIYFLYTGQKDSDIYNSILPPVTIICKYCQITVTVEGTNPDEIHCKECGRTLRNKIDLNAYDKPQDRQRYSSDHYHNQKEQNIQAAKTNGKKIALLSLRNLIRDLMR